MKPGYRLIFILSLAFIIGIFYWALLAPKPDISQRIQETLKEQEKRADLTFKDITLEEIDNGIKYWQLVAQTGLVNKSTQLASLKEVKGKFFKSGRETLAFNSPAALWDMKKKAIYLDKPIGYKPGIGNQVAKMVKEKSSQQRSVFNLALDASQDPYWFIANNLSWNMANKKLVCSGNIILKKGQVTGLGQKLEGDVSFEKIKLTGQPKIIVNTAQNSLISLEAESFEIVSAQNQIKAQGQPQVRWKSATIKAKQIDYLQGKKLLKLVEDVKVDYEEIKAQSLTAKYDIQQEIIILSGEAWAKQGQSKLAGQNILVFLREKKIKVVGQGQFVISEENFNDDNNSTQNKN